MKYKWSDWTLPKRHKVLRKIYESTGDMPAPRFHAYHIGRMTQVFQRQRQAYKLWLSAHAEATVLNATYYNR